jgi:hypothetical protein
MKTARARSFVWTRDLIADVFSFVCVAGVVVFAFSIGGAVISSIVWRGFASTRSFMNCLWTRELLCSPGAPINQLAIVQNAIFFLVL